MRLDAKLTKWADRRGLSDQDVARLMKEAGAAVSDSTVRRWRLGEIQPRLNELEALARVMEVPIVYLADATLDDLPKPEISQGEWVIVEFTRQVGLKRMVRMIGKEFGEKPIIPGPDPPKRDSDEGDPTENGNRFNWKAN